MWHTIFYNWCGGSWVLLALWPIMMILVLSIPVVIIMEIRESSRVNRFFNRYEPRKGIVNNYYYTAATSQTTSLPMIAGKAMLLIPRQHESPEAFYIELECRNKGKHFLLRYVIPQKDYWLEDIGSIVRIQSTWIRYDYTVLQD